VAKEDKGYGMKHLLSLIILVTSCVLNAVKIVVVTPTYNNERYCISNIKSVMKQTYPDFHHVIVNDSSSDRTSQLLHAYIDKHNLHDRVTLIDNAERKGALQNFYELIHKLPDDVVVVSLDGDDKFASNKTLERIAAEYKNPQVWLTYGQFTCTSGERGFCRKFPDRLISWL
jgi:glycosyltransferase involved in cell wall biosynthesis